MVLHKGDLNATWTWEFY